MKAAVLGPLLALAACGSEPSLAVGLLVRLDPQLAANARTLALFALGAQRSDGMFITCTVLLSGEIEPTEAGVEVFDRADVAFTGDESRSVSLENVPPDRSAIVFGTASDAQSRRIAQGCVDDVIVPSEQTVDVELRLYATS